MSEFTSTSHTSHKPWGEWYTGNREGTSKYVFKARGDSSKKITAEKSRIKCANCGMTPKDSGSSNHNWYMCNECQTIVCQFCKSGTQSPKQKKPSKSSKSPVVSSSKPAGGSSKGDVSSFQWMFFWVIAATVLLKSCGFLGGW